MADGAIGIEEKGGWFVKNVKDAHWYGTPAFGRTAMFAEREDYGKWDVGVRLHVLEPGKPNCRYHRETAQEDFLVLSGRCKLLVNGEEHELGPWDYFHCPPGVSHVFVGAGESPCVVVMIGDRVPDNQLYYPAHPPAAEYNAEAPEPTDNPAVAYGDVTQWAPIETPDWPLDE